MGNLTSRTSLLPLLLSLALIATLTTGCRFSAGESPPEPVSLGGGEPVLLQPGGQQLLLVREGSESFEGWLFSVDRAEARKILDFMTPSFYPAFSPDGRQLAWATDQLWLADDTGSNPMALIDDQRTLGPIAWSPDGQELAVVIDDTIVRIDRQGRQLGEIAQAESIRQLAWVSLEDGRQRILFNSFPDDEPAFIASIDPTGVDPTRLVQGEAFAIAGDRLYFSNSLEGGGLNVASVEDGSGAEQIVSATIWQFAPRPGQPTQVAYIVQDDQGGTALWLLDHGAGRPRQLTEGQPVFSPVWSEDGASIYYGRFNPNAAEEEDFALLEKIDL